MNSIKKAKTAHIQLLKQVGNKYNNYTKNLHKGIKIDINLFLTKDYILWSQYIHLETLCKNKDKNISLIKGIEDNQKYLLKAILNTNSTDESKIYNILKNKKHKHVTTYIKSELTSKYHYFIYDYIEGSDLSSFIFQHELLEKDILSIINQICLGVQFLHQNNIIHCDLKLENIRINEAKEIKIIDFDLSKVGTEYLSECIFGTNYYIAPESHDLQIYSQYSDIWSMGIIVYIILTKELPYKNKMSLTSCNNNLYRTNKFKQIEKNKVTESVKNYKNADLLFYLVNNMLQFIDSDRIKIKEIIELTDHAIKKIDEIKIN